MKNKLVLLTALLSSCFPDFSAKESDRLYLQVVKSPAVCVKWFTYSAAYADSPDFVTLEAKGRIDNLCTTDNLQHVALQGDTVRLTFSGTPRLYMEPAPVMSIAAGHPIVLDTVDLHLPPTPRKYFKR